MPLNAQPDAASVELRRWKRIALISTTVAVLSTGVLMVTAVLATQAMGTHYNLYYLLWKSGLRPYEQRVALSGLTHDRAFQKHLTGASLEQFSKTFPNTFHKVRNPPPAAKPNQEYYINDYHQAQSENGSFGLCWLAIFEDGRLTDFIFWKGN